MNIGLYFGSFNPIHTGHLIIANHVLNQTVTNKIWFVVSPQNPLKASSALLNEYDRLHLVRLAIENDSRMEASNIEFQLPRPSYTIDTLTYAAEKYPAMNFSVIMGSDSFSNLQKWKNYELILNSYSILVYKRPGFLQETIGNSNVTYLDAPLLDISSTYIRRLISQGKSARYLLPEKVWEEVSRNHYFV